MTDAETRSSVEGRSSVSDKGSHSPQDGDKHQRKRMRVPTSCAVCRKRKIKCDKVRPVCSGCSKSNVSHLCHYEEPLWVNSRDLWKHAKISSPQDQQEKALSSVMTMPLPTDVPPSSKQTFEELSARVKHIEASIAVSDLARSMSTFGSTDTPAPTAPTFHAGLNGVRYQQPPTEFIGTAQQNTGPQYDFDPDETIDLFDYLPFIVKKSRLEYHGGLDPKSFIKKDPHLKVVWMHVWKTFGKSIQANIDNSDNGSSIPGTSTQGFHELLELRKQKQQIKNETKEIFASEPNLDAIILRYLPTRKNLMMLCVRFFKCIYPSLPFINENSFFSELDTILPSGSFEERPTKLNICSKYDYVTIGLLFLVMRFAHMSIEDHEYDLKPELSVFKDVTIHAGHVMVAQKCLAQYNFLRKSYSLRVLQVMLYLKLYYRYCPEDDDISDRSEGRIMMGTIYSTALSLGLQTDPADLVSLIKSPKTQSYGQLWRKIWHKILEMDATQSMSLGIVPHCSNELSYDTLLPSTEEGMDEIDLFVTEDFQFMDKKTSLYRKISNTCFNRSKRPTVLQMVHLIREVENFVSVNLGNLKDVLSNVSLKPYARVKKVYYLYEMNSLLLSLKAHLLNHFYEKKNTKKVFEVFDECLTLSMKILNSSLNLYYNMSLYFEPGHRMLLRPISYIAIVNALLMIGGVTAKLSQCKKLVPPTDVTRLNLVNEFYNSLVNNMDTAVKLVGTVSKGYNNAQRILLALKLLLEQMKSPGFDFEHAFMEATKSTRESFPNNLKMALQHDIHTIKPEEIPRSNYVMSLLDTELSYLKSKTECNIMEALQPLVGVPANYSTTAPTNPSGTGNGQFYDPAVDSLTGKSSAMGSLATRDHSSGSRASTSFDFDNIFTNDWGKTQTYDKQNALSSDEYASLFGLFEDYSLMHFDMNDLRGL